VAQRYHELAAWQLANELKQKVYALVETSAARDDRRFADQIRDAAASGPRNLAEGFAYYRHREFAKYTRIAKGSLVELHNHLLDGIDRRYWSAAEALPLQQIANRAIGACVRLARYLETSEAPDTPKGR
jgi:four helix bundle protein